MKVVVWVAEGTWEACVDAARDVVEGWRPDEVALLHVEDPATTEAWAAGPSGLLGRGAADPDASPLHDAAAALLDDAADRLHSDARHEADADAQDQDQDQARLEARCRVRRDARRVVGRGALEREVVAACEDADLLVCARDGDRRHLGPHTLGVATRFVVDHAPCSVLLVWPEGPPGGADRLPPLPEHSPVDRPALPEPPSVPRA